MLDPRCVLVWVLKVVWQIREKKGSEEEKREIVWEFEKMNTLKWLKWDDGDKIEFEKIYTKVENIVEKN